MLFSSMVFIWVFLPLTFMIYKVLDRRFKNVFLLIASLIFYAWGEPKYILLMITSIVINYYFGIKIEDETNRKNEKALLIICVALNLALLGYFKYFNFFIEIINNVFGSKVIAARNIILPIGISFYTFQALSYVVDVYRSKQNQGNVNAQRNIFSLALYISFFPQLIAGPIIKYYDIEQQINKRHENIELTIYGIKRFIYGLSKKVLISNVMASTSDSIFALSLQDISMPMAWLGIISYTLQIYFDFSGYSDMAIGLGAMFGFNLMENFNYPYISKSIKEFWRRWHISLSTWFKEYVYIPLGGNRKGNIRTYINLMIVFFCTGLWHGANWTFIVWGLFYGIFLVMERCFLGAILEKNKFKLLNHIYVMCIVTIGWVFFRSDTISYSLGYIKRMFIPSKSSGIYSLGMYFDIQVLIVLIIGILLSGVLQKYSEKFNKIISTSISSPYKKSISYGEIVLCTMLLGVCIMELVSGAYNPFIYFRF